MKRIALYNKTKYTRRRLKELENRWVICSDYCQLGKTRIQIRQELRENFKSRN